MPPLARFALAWLAGLSAAALLAPFPGPPRPRTALWLALAGCGSFALAWRLARTRSSPRKRVLSRAILGAGLLACGLLGAARHLAALPDLASDPLVARIDTGPRVIRGRVARDPERRDRGLNYLLEAEDLFEDDRWLPAPGLVLVQGPRYPVLAYGDRLVVTATLEAPPELEDFDYGAYLARKGIYVIARRPRLQYLASGGHPIGRVLVAIRGRARDALHAALPAPESALGVGILLGDAHGIPEDIDEAFRITNTTHVIAISGSNIALLVAALQLLLGRWLGRRRAAPLVVGVVVAYSAMVGADAAVVRAAIMGSLLVLADVAGRPAHAATGLLAAAWAMTAVQPVWLGDLGFQLSFAATAGLVALAGRLGEPTKRWLTERLGSGVAGDVAGLLDEALWVTVAAQLATWPLIAWHTGQVSWAGLIANALIVPVQPAVMLLGALTSVVGALWTPAGAVLGALAWLPLTWTIRCVLWVADWPMAAVAWQPSMRFVLTWYLGFCFWSAPKAWRTQRLLQLREGSARLAKALLRLRLTTVARALLQATPLALGAACLLAWTAVRHQPDGLLHIFLLDVGQGDALFVVSPSGRRMLIDGGPAPSAVLAGVGRHVPPWDRRLDVVLLSHPDADHVAGLPSVLERYRVDLVVDAADEEHDTSDTQAWREALRREQVQGASQRVARAGDRLVLDAEAGVSAEVLWPPQGAMPPGMDAVNDRSVVLRLSYGQVHILFTGDISEAVEKRLVGSNAPLGADVLKLAHHGSSSSSDPTFLAAVGPRLVLIGVGEDNRFGHPAPDVLDRLGALPGRAPIVARSDQHGEVELLSDGEGLWLRGWP
jgi:competence protein ComEC